MTETLSQSEIDLLFSGGGAPAAPAPRRGAADVQLYDFQRPNLISKDRLRTLKAMYGMLTKSVEGWLTSRTRGGIELSLIGVEHLSFGEFVLSLPTPSSSFVYDLKNSGGQQAVIDFGREFAFFAVERLLGGSGKSFVPDRSLTPLERMLVRLAADQVAQQLTDVWRDHVPMELVIDRFESLPDMLQIANREDPVLVGNIEVIAAGTRSLILVCLPFTVLEKFFTGDGPQRRPTVMLSDRERESDKAHVELSLLAARIPVSIRMPAFAVPLRSLAGLAPGAVLATPVTIHTPAALYVAGQARFRARVGSAGSHYAAQILEPLTSAAGPGPHDSDPRWTAIGPLESLLGHEAAPGPAALGVGEGATQPAGELPLAALYGLTVSVAIEFGRTSLTIQEILGLGRGSVVQLRRLIGEPVDVLVGDRRFAEGEVVVLGESFGVRITRVVASPTSPQEAK